MRLLRPGQTTRTDEANQGRAHGTSRNGCAQRAPLGLKPFELFENVNDFGATLVSPCSKNAGGVMSCVSVALTSMTAMAVGMLLSTARRMARKDSSVSFWQRSPYTVHRTMSFASFSSSTCSAGVLHPSPSAIALMLQPCNFAAVSASSFARNYARCAMWRPMFTMTPASWVSRPTPWSYP